MRPAVLALTLLAAECERPPARQTNGIRVVDAPRPPAKAATVLVARTTTRPEATSSPIAANPSPASVGAPTIPAAARTVTADEAGKLNLELTALRTAAMRHNEEEKTIWID